MAKDDQLDFDDLDLPDDDESLGLPDEGLDSLDSPDGDIPDPQAPTEEWPGVEAEAAAEEGLPEGDDFDLPVPSAEGSEATEEEEESEGEQKKGKKGGRARKAKKGRKPKSSKDTSDKDTSDKGFVERLTSASPYTVMLAISLLAMIIAVFLLFAELKWGYDLDIKANTLKEKLGAAPPAVQVEPPNTTAVA